MDEFLRQEFAWFCENTADPVLLVQIMIQTNLIPYGSISTTMKTDLIASRLYTMMETKLTQKDSFEGFMVCLRSSGNQHIANKFESFGKPMEVDKSGSSDPGQRKDSFYLSNFKHVQVLGQGGFGKVLKAENLNDLQTYAVKVIPSISDHDPDIIAKKEVDNITRVDNTDDSENKQHVVRYYSSWKESVSLWNYPFPMMSTHMPKGLYFIQMELCTEGTLQQWLNRAVDQKNQQLHPQFMVYFIQVVKGVEFLHRNNIMHRDLKPSNILLTKLESGEIIAKIGDMGLLHALSFPGSDSEKTKGVGTTYYRSPEQTTSRQYDLKTDIYSLGKILKVAVGKASKVLPLKPEHLTQQNSLYKLLTSEKPNHRPNINQLLQFLLTTFNQQSSRDNDSQSSHEISSERDGYEELDCLELLCRSPALLERIELRKVHLAALNLPWIITPFVNLTSIWLDNFALEGEVTLKVLLPKLRNFFINQAVELQTRQSMIPQLSNENPDYEGSWEVDIDDDFLELYASKQRVESLLFFKPVEGLTSYDMNSLTGICEETEVQMLDQVIFSKRGIRELVLGEHGRLNKCLIVANSPPLSKLYCFYFELKSAFFNVSHLTHLILYNLKLVGDSSSTLPVLASVLTCLLNIVELRINFITDYRVILSLRDIASTRLRVLALGNAALNVDRRETPKLKVLGFENCEFFYHPEGNLANLLNLFEAEQVSLDFRHLDQVSDDQRQLVLKELLRFARVIVVTNFERTNNSVEVEHLLKQAKVRKNSRNFVLKRNGERNWESMLLKVDESEGITSYHCHWIFALDNFYPFHGDGYNKFYNFIK